MIIKLEKEIMDRTNEQAKKASPELLAQTKRCDKLADKITSWKSKPIVNQFSKEENCIVSLKYFNKLLTKAHLI